MVKILKKNHSKVSLIPMPDKTQGKTCWSNGQKLFFSDYQVLKKCKHSRVFGAGLVNGKPKDILNIQDEELLFRYLLPRVNPGEIETIQDHYMDFCPFGFLEQLNRPFFM